MRRFSSLVLTALFLTGFAVADDPAPKEETGEKGKTASEAKDDEDEVLTFSTEDLERKYGPSSKPPEKKAVEPAGKDANAKGKQAGAKTLSPLEQMQANQQASKDRAAQRKDAATKVEKARARVKELEQRVSRLRNPLLGRAEAEDGEEAAWSKADQAGRVKIAEDALQSARTELQAAIKEMDELR